MAHRVLVDACVLFSRLLRDQLFLLKQASGGGMFTLAGTCDILAETVYSIRRKRPDMTGGQISRIDKLIRENLDEMIEEFEPHEFPGSDIDDSHVHSAAISAKVDIVLTADAGWATAGVVDYDVYSPDQFFSLVHDSAPDVSGLALDKQIAYWHKKSPDGVNLVERFRAAECPEYALRAHQYLLQTRL